MMAVDRRDIINDDLGAITTVPRKLGRGSGLKINDVFWTVFLANSGFFTVGNKNFLSGTDTVLSIDGLTKAEVAYYDLVDSDGKPPPDHRANSPCLSSVCQTWAAWIKRSPRPRRKRMSWGPSTPSLP
jgi:hypothetical protein